MQSPMTVVVGESYLVPCIKDYSGWMPIIGPAHEDGREICVNPTELHYHYDFRFIAEDIKTPTAARATVFGKPVPIEAQWRECLRSESDNGSLLFAQLRLMEQFAGHRLCNLVCPHKGIPLVGTGDLRKCPGHGLTWNIATGCLHFTPPYFLRIKGTEELAPATTLGDLKIKLDPNMEVDVCIELLDSAGLLISEYTIPHLRLSKGDNLILNIDCTKSNQV